jgi:hypothetical protein
VCAFGQSSFSAGPSEPTSAAASASAAVLTPVVGTPAGSLGVPGAAATSLAAAVAVAAATAAAAAVEVSPTGTDHTEHSFTDNVQPHSRGAAAASPGAAHGVVHVKGSSSNHSSFSGFAPTQPGSSAATAAAGSNDAGGWQQQDNVSIGDAGLSSIAPSNAAVAGSAPGSVSFGPISRDGSSHKLPHSMLVSATGQPVTAVQASSTTRSVQWSHLQGSSNASSSQQQDGRQRRVPGATAAGVYSRQSSRGLSDTAAGVRGSDDQQPSRFPWGRMESLKRRNSKK